MKKPTCRPIGKNYQILPMPKVVPIKNNPDWLDSELWADYIQYRVEINSPLTPVGEKRALKKLKRMMDKGGDQTAMIEATITSKKRWAGIFYREKETYETHIGGISVESLSNEDFVKRFREEYPLNDRETFEGYRARVMYERRYGDKKPC